MSSKPVLISRRFRVTQIGEVCELLLEQNLRLTCDTDLLYAVMKIDTFLQLRLLLVKCYSVSLQTPAHFRAPGCKESVFSLKQCNFANEDDVTLLSNLQNNISIQRNPFGNHLLDEGYQRDRNAGVLSLSRKICSLFSIQVCSR